MLVLIEQLARAGLVGVAAEQAAQEGARRSRLDAKVALDQVTRIVPVRVAPDDDGGFPAGARVPDLAFVAVGGEHDGIASSANQMGTTCG